MKILTTKSTIDVLDTKINETAKSINTLSTAIGTTLSDSIDDAAVSLEEYKKVVDELKGYLNGTLDGEWAYVYGDKIYTSKKVDQFEAAEDISAQRSNDLGSYVPWATIYGSLKQIPHYASGTLSAKGGLSKVGENGAELRVLNQGDGIIPANVTANLMAIGENPAKYFHIDYERVISSLASSSMIANTLKTMFGDIPPLPMSEEHYPSNATAPVINITIQGDATQSTVRALRAEADNIVKRAVNTTMSTALKYSNVPKRR